jgi:hypothetical protein
VRRVFISHGSRDTWIAQQMSRCITDCGAETFIDVNDVASGDDFKKRIQAEIARADEMVALFTALSVQRSWVWIEIGAAWVLEKRIVGIIYGMTVAQFERASGGKAVLQDLNLRDLNEFDVYLEELRQRIAHGR